MARSCDAVYLRVSGMRYRDEEADEASVNSAVEADWAGDTAEHSGRDGGGQGKE